MLRWSCAHTCGLEELCCGSTTSEGLFGGSSLSEALFCGSSLSEACSSDWNAWPISGCSSAQHSLVDYFCEHSVHSSADNRRSRECWAVKLAIGKGMPSLILACRASYACCERDSSWDEEHSRVLLRHATPAAGSPCWSSLLICFRVFFRAL